MAKSQKSFMSFVALGTQNPQILNIDWLKNNKILPDNEPFNSLLKQERPFEKFVSTPPFTHLKLGNVALTVEQERFQVRQDEISDWDNYCVLEIARNYYDKLPHTPLNKAGVNLNFLVTFDNLEEARNLEALFVPENAKIRDITKKDIDVNLSVRFAYKEPNKRMQIALERLTNKEEIFRHVNFNYEFDLQDNVKLNEQLADIKEVYDYTDKTFDEILNEIQ